MSALSAKNRTVAISVGLSLAVHLVILCSLGRFGNYSFAAPVSMLQAVMVDVATPRSDAPPAADADKVESSPPDDGPEDVPVEKHQSEVQGQPANMPVSERVPSGPNVREPAAIDTEKPTEIITRPGEPAPTPQTGTPRHTVPPPAPGMPPPLRTAGEFLTTQSEKLTYLICLLGVPVGNVELEAKNDNGELRIALRTKTNSALSSLYPVDNLMETRHIGGNFIITKIRQREGSVSSDIGFTIFLRDKRVFWVDRTRNRVSNETIPTSDVLDTLSSFYYLRNRPLKTGTTELLHVYDGDVYAPVPVEILRQEEVRLRNLTTVNCLLVRHVKQKDGIFRRSGDMLIWLTNDAYKVPVKVVTTSPVGKVTVELVAAETQQFDRPGSQNGSR